MSEACEKTKEEIISELIQALEPVSDIPKNIEKGYTNKEDFKNYWNQCEKKYVVSMKMIIDYVRK